MKPVLHINKLSGASFSDIGEGMANEDKAKINEGIFKGISDIITGFGGILRSAMENSNKALTERREIIRQSLQDFYNMDNNKNSNLGFVIVTGAAVVILFAYVIVKKLKKR